MSASKIKSAIVSRGIAQRQYSKDYADVSSSLLESQLSQGMYGLEKKESEEFYGTLSSGLETLDTLSEGFKQKKELKSNISAFEESLPEGSDLRIEKKSNLMDWISGEAKLSDVMYGEDKYYLGERKLGSKYDVAARGKQIIAKDSIDELIGNMEGEKYTSNVNRTLSDFNPQLNFDLKKYQTMLSQSPFQQFSLPKSKVEEKEYFISDEEGQKLGFG